MHRLQPCQSFDASTVHHVDDLFISQDHRSPSCPVRPEVDSVIPDHLADCHFRLVLNLREAATRQLVLAASGPSGTVSIETWATADPTRSSDIAFNARKPLNPITSFIGLHEFDAPLDGSDDGNTAPTTVDTSDMNANDYELSQLQPAET